MSKLERRPTKLPAQQLARRALGAAVTIGTGTLIVTLAIDQPISIDISGKVEGRAKVIIGTPQAVDEAIRELPPVRIAQQVAFPSAEGYGAQATWGLRWATTQVARAGFLPLVAAVAVPNDSICDRSGAKIYFVTNTDDSGAGSLRDIVEDSTAVDTMKFVIFRTGGRITLSTGGIALGGSGKDGTCWYIAGQTAPGGGIQLYRDNRTGLSVDRTGADHIIVRYLRVDGDSGAVESDAISVQGGQYQIWDHISTRFGTDETFSLTAIPANDSITNVTIQWAVIGPGLTPHSAGTLFNGATGGAIKLQRITFHHNYWPHNSARSPRAGDEYVDSVETINTVIYNWKNAGCSDAGGSAPATKWDMVRNYVKVGPWGVGKARRECQFAAVLPPFVYLDNNVLDSLGTVLIDSLDNQRDFWNEDAPPHDTLPSANRVGSRQNTPTVAVTEQSASVARTAIEDSVGMFRRLDCDGTWVNARDALDDSLIAHLQNNTGPSTDAENNGPGDYNGLPTPATGTACTDTDSDGIPDTYETAQCGTTTCMDPRADTDGDGYIDLEEYLNGTGG